MTGVQEQDHGCDELVFAQFAAVAFGDEKLTDEIVAKIAAPRASEAAHIIGESAGRLGRAILDRAIAPNWYMATMRCDQSTSLGPMSRGTPSRSAITATGMGLANSATRSAERIARKSRSAHAPAFRSAVRAFDPARDEGAIDEVAQASVLGRLELEHRMALERIERLKMRSRLAPTPPDSTDALSARTGGRAAAPRHRRSARSTRSRSPPRRTPARLRGSRRRLDRDR